MLIAFEGIDGSGKGTQAARLRDALVQSGLDVGLMAFPRYEDTDLGKVVGEFLRGEFGTLDQVHPKLASIPYALDRWQSLPLIQANLTVRDVLICDRYCPSNVAHQCAKLSHVEACKLAYWLGRLEYEILGLPQPDLVICLDLPAAVAQQRIAQKAKRAYTEKPDIHEANLAYLEKVREGYHLASRLLVERGGKWVWVNTIQEGRALNVDEVHAEVWQVVSEVCGKRLHI